MRGVKHGMVQITGAQHAVRTDQRMATKHICMACSVQFAAVCPAVRDGAGAEILDMHWP